MITQYTDQEAFDKALRCVTKQARPSTDDSRCRYRSSDGRKCAIGHLVSDDELFQLAEMAGLEPHDFENVGAPFIAERIGIYVVLACDMQRAHDSCWLFKQEHFVETFRERMLQVAKVHGLEFPVDVSAS